MNAWLMMNAGTWEALAIAPRARSCTPAEWPQLARAPLLLPLAAGESPAAASQMALVSARHGPRDQCCGACLALRQRLPRAAWRRIAVTSGPGRRLVGAARTCGAATPVVRGSGGAVQGGSGRGIDHEPQRGDVAVMLLAHRADDGAAGLHRDAVAAVQRVAKPRPPVGGSCV